MKYFTIIMLILSLYSCAPKEFKPILPNQINIQEVNRIVLPELAKKPVFPEGIKLDVNLHPTDEAKKVIYVAYNANEFKNLRIINTLSVDERLFLEKQVDLTNNYIDALNEASKLFKFEQEKTRHYITLWSNSENAYLQERYQRDMDNFTNRSSLYAVTVAFFIVIAVIL